MEIGGKSIKIIGAAVLWILLGAGGITGWADEAGTVTLRSEEELVRWYRDTEKPDEKTAILDGRVLCISKQVVLGPPGDPVNGTVKQNVELQIQGGPVRITGQKGSAPGELVIDHPNLTVRGSGSLFSVEGYGRLFLKKGAVILSEEPKPETGPATVFLKNYSEFAKEDSFRVMVEKNGSQEPSQMTVKDERTDPPETDPAVPGENGSQPGGGSQAGPVPELAEAVLLNIGPDGSGSVRLEFENLPGDINALYLYRSDDGHTWTKEKNKVAAASSQSGQDMVEYENFLKESGNTLNLGILEDGYLIYRFPPMDSSFYVKSRIEWPSGGRDTQRIKVAIPDSAGQGLTFVYGGGYEGGYGGYGNYGSYGSYGGSGGLGDSSLDASSRTQPNSQEEQDAPEAPVRRGGRSRGRSAYSSYVPYTAMAQEEGPERPWENGPELSTPSTPSVALDAGEGKNAGERMAQVQAGPASGSAVDAGGADTASEDAGQENQDMQGPSGKRKSPGKWYAGVITAAVAAGASIWVYIWKRR